MKKIDLKKLYDATSSVGDFLSRNAKKVVIASSMTAALLAGTISAPYINKAYKKHQANNVLVATDKGISELEDVIDQTKKSLDENGFILLEKEKQECYKEIEDSTIRSLELQKEMQTEINLFEMGHYDAVRRSLDESFDLPKGKTRITPFAIAQREIEEIDSVKRKFSHKRQGRDSAIKQEGDLMARLASPLVPPVIERKDKHAVLTNEQFKWIPILSRDLEVALKEVPAELHNSLGVMLINHKPILEHIIKYAKAERTKDRATGAFENAKESYMQVMALNDSLTVFYRAKQHDGTFRQEDYDALLSAQKKPLDLIALGDGSLARLKACNDELHDQYFTYVSGHDKSLTTFRHIRTVPTLDFDEDGNASVGLDTEDYKTEGYKFYYVKITVTPQQKTKERIYVGEKDTDGNLFWRTWNYPREQQIGYLIEWKQFHNDNQGIIRGGSIKDINPHIEEKTVECYLNN